MTALPGASSRALLDRIGCRMSLLALLQTGCLAAFAILLLVAGWQDLRTLLIANRLSLATIAAFAVWAAAGIALGRMSATTLALAIACSVALFAIAAAGFAGGVLGGADAAGPGRAQRDPHRPDRQARRHALAVVAARQPRADLHRRGQAPAVGLRRRCGARPDCGRRAGDRRQARAGRHARLHGRGPAARHACGECADNGDVGGVGLHLRRRS